MATIRNEDLTGLDEDPAIKAYTDSDRFMASASDFAEEESSDDVDKLASGLVKGIRQAVEKDQKGRKKPTENIFCPTGPGGGVDPTCSPGSSTGSHAGINSDGSFDKQHWIGLGSKARDEWAALPVSVRDRAADPAKSIPKRIKENLDGIGEVQNSHNAHADIEHRVKQMSDRITPDSSAKIVEVSKGYNDELVRAGVNPRTAREMSMEATDYLAAQEIEASRRTLGDHGIAHIKGNIDMAKDIMNVVPGEDPAATKAAMMTTMIYHDAGYLCEPSQVFLDEGHPRWGAQAYSQLQHSKVSEALGYQAADEVQHMIRTHDATNLDWDGDVAASAVRVADNAALFKREKLPPVFKNVPENVQVLKDLSAKSISVEAARSKMIENIDASNHPQRLKDGMKAAANEVNPSTGKFTLGMLGGEVNRFEWNGEGVRIHLRESAAVTELNKLGDFGQRQFGKLADTYGVDPKQFKKSLPFQFRDNRGRLVLEGVVDEELAANKKLADNAFCPTGPGGGKDPTCGSGGNKKVAFDPIQVKRRSGEYKGLSEKRKQQVLDAQIEAYNNMGPLYRSVKTPGYKNLSPEKIAANREIGKFEGMAAAYLDRAEGLKGSDRRIYQHMALDVLEQAESLHWSVMKGKKK